MTSSPTVAAQSVRLKMCVKQTNERIELRKSTRERVQSQRVSDAESQGVGERAKKRDNFIHPKPHIFFSPLPTSAIFRSAFFRHDTQKKEGKNS